MRSALYAVAVKERGAGDLVFRPPYKGYLEALEMAEELGKSVPSGSGGT